ncbi:MAG: Eco57I restriction-modification methylase domain-containing protein [Bacteroidales bacterium]|nr:Eco57I restriction-modification methylase domain-containing protein [Bacteroidales bacterium]
MKQDYSPDILNCLANLSSDEVFTSPELANRMLDLLPQELFRSSKTCFLDPCAKSGVFLREIAKRLLAGLEEQIPDLQQRIDHIMARQVFGIACTDLTAEMSRRTLYCSKQANGEYSVSTAFRDQQGNLRYDRCHHTWNAQGRCEHCGASKGEYLRTDSHETYAYPFIHKSIKEIFHKDMQFDVIIGNPPYQLSKATDKTTNNGAFASAIYPMFIDQAIAIHPQYLIMIVPSRWMTRTGQGISDDWVDKMVKGNHIVELHDYLDSTQCFAGVEIKGGVNYFLYSEKYEGKCRYVLHQNEIVVERNDYLDMVGAGVVIRDAMAISILQKVVSVEGKYFLNNSFSSAVSPKHFFDRDDVLGSNWKGYSVEQDKSHKVKLYVNRKLESCGYGWIKESDVPKNIGTLPLHKVFIPKAGGSGTDSIILGNPFYSEPNSVCSYTYLCIGYDPQRHNYSKEQCMNIISYIRTCFFRYLVSVKKKTQDAARDVYQFVPLQDFSHPWTDEMLYKKYGLTEDEIAFIESMIHPME